MNARTLCRCWVGICLLVLGPRAVAAEPEPAPGLLPPSATSVLVLKAGQVFEGEVRLEGDSYAVRLPYGEIRVRSADVDLVCRDLRDGYEQKRALIQQGSVNDHLNLAQWCQRQRLFDLAQQEIAFARQLDPQNPRVALYAHRLEMVISNATAAEEPIAKRSGTAIADDVSFDELDRLVRQAPPGSVETFTQAIQPLLTNGCTASGCHGPQSETSLRLLKTTVDQPSSRRSTQRNLYAVLRHIDLSNPGESRLLQMAAKPHGTLKVAPFDERQGTQFRRLVDWAYQMAATPSYALPQEILARAQSNPAETPADGVMRALHVAEESAPQAVQQAGYQEPVDDPFARFGAPQPASTVRTAAQARLAEIGAMRRDAADAPAPSGGGNEPLPVTNFPGAVTENPEIEALRNMLQEGRPDVQRGARIESFSPQDPFDPEIFNRRHFPARPQQ